ncbi:WD domain-containing protein [Camillea tinctor]|nr:WD domain-containing protein [Camillea tinctor]
MPSTINNDEWDLPRLRASIGFEDDFQYLSSDDQDTEFFDVKFYPYGDETHDPVFAAVSKKHQDALNCSCTWSKDPETEIPWLCVAGRDAKIKVYDVVNGKLVKNADVVKEINDLATNPANFLLIASASDDTTIRIWSLDPAHDKQPCVCLLGGEGHSAHLLTVAFHRTGRYVLSAGHDNVVCMWTLPELPAESSGKNPPEPIVIHYPHFFTSEVHSGIVDCVAFFGDLVLSRACHEDIIVLWRIEGFSSQDPPPAASDAPTTSDTERLTRSAFAPATSSACPPQYTRLLQFYTPWCGHQFYLRFKLFHSKNKHPILAFGNAHSTIFFWDLARLMSYHDFINDVRDPNRDKSQPIHRPGWLVPIQHRHKGDAVNKLRDAVSDRESVVSGRTGSIDVETHVDQNADYSQETLDAWEGKYDMTRVEEPIKAHSQSNITVKDFVGRQVAWSGNGEWCVVVGSKNLAIVLQRWQKKDKGEEKKPSVQ